jgi:bifunctional UDP-N-acetylglucosamine pyrophosphorylase/glucosamine-1-phosphate N-acetyltransferase
MVTELPEKIKKLMQKGVLIPHPLSVEIGDDVDLEKISGQRVVLHAGSRILGRKTVIGPGSRLGTESPAVVADCQVGPAVELKGGFFSTSVFLKSATLASGAHVRECCILEEEASGAHTVGLKHTILFPFVTLGSLINFCDCLMSGGTSRKNHSEVGSSYIHFNFTPNQDKATPSLIGDVPRGVMLRERPIFLGGQGGLVGPARIGFGTVVPAGVICREDIPEDGKIAHPGNPERTEKEFHPEFYAEVQRKVFNNLLYLGNLYALRQWYLHVRKPFFDGDRLDQKIFAGALEKIEGAIDERLSRLGAFAGKMEKSIRIGERVLKGKKKILLRQEKELQENWTRVEKSLRESTGEEGLQKKREGFLQSLHEGRASGDYTDVIRGLNKNTAATGTAWLQSIVDATAGRALKALPSFQEAAGTRRGK